MTKAKEKQRLRRVIRNLERQLSPRYKTESSAAIAAHLLAMPEYQAAGTVFCFVGTEREIDTRPILESAIAAGKRLCVPLCMDKGIMELREVTALSQLVPGADGFWSRPQTRRWQISTRWIFPFCHVLPVTTGATVWARAAGTTTAFYPIIGAARYCCAGRSSSGRKSPWSREICPSPGY